MRAIQQMSALGLRSLRTFEAAARNLNFTRAAEEMHVTTAAISHHVKEVESQLGVLLFDRQGKTLGLTVQGELLQQSVAEAIAALERGIRLASAHRRADQVTVSAAPSVAAKWLVPRLERFLSRFPTADIRVNVSFAESDFESEEADLFIRYGLAKVPFASAEKLFVESVFPVCSPRLLGSRGVLRSAQDLLNYKLIHVDWATSRGHWPTWSTWMQAAGVQEFNTAHGIHFQQTALAIEAAIAGQGIALGEASLVADDLASGRLIKPMAMDIEIQADWAYYLVTRDESLSNPLVKEFQAWLLAEAHRPPDLGKEVGQHSYTGL